VPRIDTQARPFVWWAGRQISSADFLPYRKERGMTFKQFFPIPLFIAVLATTLVMLDLQPNPLIPHLWTWISFQAWAMYFLAGCTLKGGARVFLGYLGGALASIAIIKLIGLIGEWVPQLDGPPAKAIAVFLVVIPVIAAERVPMFNFVPAWFIGAGVFFGVMTLKGNMTPEEQNKALTSTTIHLMVSCAVGLVYGVVTVLIRGKYEAWLKAKAVQPVTAED
jgi:hypothetical protein